MVRRLKNPIPVAVLVALPIAIGVVLLPAHPALSQCNVSCAGTNPVVCYVSADLAFWGCQSGTSISTATLPPQANAQCTAGIQGDKEATASHWAASGPNPKCSFEFDFVCNVSGGGFAGTDYRCLVDTADGLPVELMEFSVESSAS